jgi:hypothetical protein
MRAEAPVNVLDSDTHSVDLHLSDGVQITGSVVHLEKDQPVFGDIVTLTDTDPVDRVPYTMVPAEDGSIRLEHIFPGTYRVQAMCPRGFASSLTAEQEDILAAHTLKIGDSPITLQLTCSTKIGNISGTIDTGELNANAQVLFLDSSGKEDPVPVGVNGREFQAALAPGRYKAYLLTATSLIEYRNPSVSEQLQGGVDVQVNSGEVTRLTLNGNTR